MRTPRKLSPSAERAVHATLRLADEQEQRLRSVVESGLASPDEKFRALADLALLTEALFRLAAEANAEKLSQGYDGPEAESRSDDRGPLCRLRSTQWPVPEVRRKGTTRLSSTPPRPAYTKV
ncbi:MAG TPA: hypothetical protein VGN01_02460 [Acidobacteriaceae bacterium]